jgi:Mrp family chromosome partitioning ATPase
MCTTFDTSVHERSEGQGTDEIVAVYTTRGGVGKTISAVNLDWEASTATWSSSTARLGHHSAPRTQSSVLVAGDGTVTEGGYPQGPHLNGGYAVLKLDTRAEAVEWATKITSARRC